MSLGSFLGSMQNLIQGLQQTRVELTLDNFAFAFQKMPSMEVPNTLVFSELIEQAGANAAQAGTLLQSNGSTVAVLLDLKQYKAVDAIIKVIPLLIENMQKTLQAKLDFKNKFLEIFNSELILSVGKVYGQLLPWLIGVGTILTVSGAVFLGRAHHQYENTSDPAKKSLKGCIFPAVPLVFGIGILAFSVFTAHRASNFTFALEKVIRYMSD